MRNYLAFVLLIVLFVYSCKKDTPVFQETDLELKTLIAEKSPTGELNYFAFPVNDLSKIPQDPNNPLTEEKIELGKLLFHEVGLHSNSRYGWGNNTVSCASCHHAGAGFYAGRNQSIGEGGIGFGLNGETRSLNPAFEIDSMDLPPIKSPTTLNIAYHKVLLWSGMAGSSGVNLGTISLWNTDTLVAQNIKGFEGAETQALIALRVHRMWITEQLITDLGYKTSFDNVFSNYPISERYSNETVAMAIAAYERSQLTTEAPFQKWLNGDVHALTENQKVGAELFFGKANCVSCHSGPNLASDTFHAMGMQDLQGNDITISDWDAFAMTAIGRGSFMQDPAYRYQFKVPQLYNLKDNQFYGHGGSHTSIYSIVRYMLEGQSENLGIPVLSDRFNSVSYSNEELNSLVDFIENGLYDNNLVRFVPSSLPSGNCFPNADTLSKQDLNCN